MPTETLPTRSAAPAAEQPSRGFLFALLGHLAFFAAIAGFAFISARVHNTWGEKDPLAGAVQATAVDALPLPPRQRFDEKNVLASEKPSIAPTPPPPTPAPPVKTEAPKPRTEPPPKPDEIAIPNKTQSRPKPAPPAEREQPAPTPKRVTPPPPPTPKATTGDSAGIRIPESAFQIKNGNSTVSVPDRAFGDRYAYYIRTVARLINAQKAQDADGPDTKGKRVIIHFVIDHDGVPTEVEVQTRSGSAALDTSTLHAVQRVDTFGPLPSGNSLPVNFVWDSQ